MKIIIHFLLYITLITINQNTIGQEYGAIDALNNQSFQLIRSNPDSATKLLEQSILLASTENYQWGLATAMSLKGRLLMIQRHDINALTAFQKSLRAYELTDSVVLNNQSISYRNMAAIMTRNHQHEMAMAYYDSSIVKLKLFIKQYPDEARLKKRSKAMSDIVYFKALATKKSGDLLEASKTLTTLWANSQPVSSHGRVLNQLGLINKDLKNYSEAKYFYKQVLELNGVRPIDQGHALHNYGYTFIVEGKYDSAQWYLRQAVDKWQEILLNDKSSTAIRGLFASRLDLGECLFNQGFYSQAIVHWEKALEIDLNIEKNPELFIIHNWLQQTYMLFDIDKANQNGATYRAYRDEFLNNKSTVAAQFEGQVFRLRLQEQNTSDGYLQALSNQQRTFYIHLLLAISCSLLLFYICFRLVKRFRHKRFHSKMHRIATKNDQ